MSSEVKISVIIPTFNCNSYLEKTIRSVLSQDLGEEKMEIIVVDDFSIQSPEELVKKIGDGRIKFHRQSSNIGHIKNFESGINISKGEIIHILHGDDFILPGFYSSMLEMYELFPEIGACFCRHFFVDEQDNIMYISDLLSKSNTVFENLDRRLIMGQCIQTPSITVRRNTYNKLGYFNPDLSWCEDWEMWYRIAMNFKFGYVHLPLASYRLHSNSSSGRKTLTGENLEDLIRIRKIFTENIESDLISKFNRNFRSLLKSTAISNYNKSIESNYEKSYIHLKHISKYSDNLFEKIKMILKYHVKKWI
jgi:glycosyltransferase involved in cell wall biosynthesis